MISWHLNKVSHDRGWGFLFRFFDPGAGVLHWKAVPRAGILMEKISGPGISPGGMVTGQIDTCITLSWKSLSYVYCLGRGGGGGA